MPDLTVRLASDAHRRVLERLWLMFRHDMSEFDARLPGMRAVLEVVGRHPGSWEVAFQDANTAAVSFWRRVATDIAGQAWTETRRPVPGRPELPPDVWISFEVPT